MSCQISSDSVSGAVAPFGIQYIYLDFDGESAAYHNTELDLHLDRVEVENSRLTAERITAITAALNDRFADSGVLFVTERPTDRKYSTVYVGRTSAFDSYGAFAGLSETVDLGNENRSDNAFVMLDASSDDADIVDTIAHEAGHLVGSLDHGGEGVEKFARAYVIFRNDGIKRTTLKGQFVSEGLQAHFGRTGNILEIYYGERKVYSATITPTDWSTLSYFMDYDCPYANGKFEFSVSVSALNLPEKQEGTNYVRLTFNIKNKEKSTIWSDVYQVSSVGDVLFDQTQKKPNDCVLAATINALKMLGKDVSGSYDTLAAHYGVLVGEDGCGLGLAEVLEDGGLTEGNDFSRVDGSAITYSSLKGALDKGFAVMMRYDNPGGGIGHAITVDKVRLANGKTIVRYTDSGDNQTGYLEAELKDGKLFIDNEWKGGVRSVIVKNADNWKKETLTGKQITTSAEQRSDVQNMTITPGGSVVLDNGGSIGGKNSIYGGRLNVGTGVSVAANTAIGLYMAYERPSQAPVIGNLGNLAGASISVKVESNQLPGRYGIACNAGSFSGTISVDASDLCDGVGASVGGCHTVFETAHLGDLRPGDEIRCGTAVYRLELDSDAALILSVAYDAASGDLNGDGRADIVMTISQSGHAADGSTGAWLIQADQTAAWGDLSQRNAGWEIFGTGVTTAGKTTCDVYVKSADNVIGAWTTDATGKVAGWETVGQFDASTQVLGLGDFNGDGQTDLLLRNTNGAVGCYFTSGETLGWNYFQSLGDEWTVSAVGDLNGDGRDDVVLKNAAGYAGTWLTQSDYTMALANLDTLADGFSIVGCGDFDGNGTSDVLLRQGTYYGAWTVENGGVSGWMGLGDLGDITVEQIGDFDADGIDDLRIRTSAGDLGSQLVKGADNLDWKYYGSVGTEWSTSLASI